MVIFYNKRTGVINRVWNGIYQTLDNFYGEQSADFKLVLDELVLPYDDDDLIKNYSMFRVNTITKKLEAIIDVNRYTIVPKYPELTIASPITNDLTNIDINTNIILTFSNEISNYSEITLTTTDGIIVSCNMFLDSTNKVLTTTTSKNLSYSTKYNININNVIDIYNQTLSNTTITFTTVAAPILPLTYESSITNGAVDVDVVISEIITFNNEIVDYSGIDITSNDGTVIDSNISLDDTKKILTINPNENLANSTVYNVNLVNVKDIYNQVLENTVISFITIASANTTTPTEPTTPVDNSSSGSSDNTTDNQSVVSENKTTTNDTSTIK